MSALGTPWSLEKLIRRQAGGLYLFLPKGTVISSDKGKRSWTLAEDSKRVQGPDGTLTSLLETTDDTKAVVLSRSRRKGKLALLHVKRENPRAIVPPALPDLVDPMVFLPGDFSTPGEEKTHAGLVRQMWAQAPEEVRRDLSREQAERDRLLSLPHVQAPVLLWLLGARALERTLSSLGVVSPSGSAGVVQCMQVEQPASRQGARQIHVVLRATQPGKEQVRMCLPYAPGAIEFGSVALEFRELPGESGRACPLSSSRALFSQEPLQVRTKRLVFCVAPTGETGGEGDGWQLLQEPNLPQEDVLRSLWGVIPGDLRRALTALTSSRDDAQQASTLLVTGIDSTLKNGALTEKKAEIIAQAALDGWMRRSVFSRLEAGLFKGGTLQGTLLRSFRYFCIDLAMLQTWESAEELQGVLEQLRSLASL